MSNLQMAQSLGFSLAHASLLISVVGVTNTLGRIFSGWITDLPNFRCEVLDIVLPYINICLLCQRPRGDDHRHWDLLHLPGLDASHQLLPNPRCHQVIITIMIITIVNTTIRWSRGGSSCPTSRFCWQSPTGCTCQRWRLVLVHFSSRFISHTIAKSQKTYF